MSKKKIEKYKVWELTPDDRFCGNDIVGLKEKVNEIIDYLKEINEDDRIYSWQDTGCGDIKDEVLNGLDNLKVEWKDGSILNTVDKDGIVHTFELKELSKLSKKKL